MRTFTTLACCVVIGAATASDVSLRVAYERGGGDYTLKVDTPLGSSSDDRTWDDSNTILAGVSAGASLVRGGVFALYRKNEESGSGADLTDEIWGGRAELGLSIPFIPKLLHLEAMPFIEVDRHELEYDTGFGGDKDDDTAVAYGGHLDLVVTAAIVEGGLGVGWIWSDAEFDEVIGAGSTTVKVEESTWFGRVFVGLRF